MNWIKELSKAWIIKSRGRSYRIFLWYGHIHIYGNFLAIHMAIYHIFGHIPYIWLHTIYTGSEPYIWVLNHILGNYLAYFSIYFRQWKCLIVNIESFNTSLLSFLSKNRELTWISADLLLRVLSQTKYITIYIWFEPYYKVCGHIHGCQPNIW